MSNYLAVDLGASSYRMVLSDGENLEEIARYKDHLVESESTKKWDITRIYNNIVKCLEYLKKSNIVISSMSINSWGCDFAEILDEYKYNDKGILETQVWGNSYLNGISASQRANLMQHFTEQELFELTAVNCQDFNTIYRVDQINKRILFITSYLNFLLTGVETTDLSILSTTQMLDKMDPHYSPAIIEKIGVNTDFLPLISPNPISSQNIQFDMYKYIKVIFGTGHDTSYAFYNYNQDTIIINVGSWIICGLNIEKPQIFDNNFNYERGLKCKYKVVNNGIGMNGYNKLLKEHKINISLDEVSEKLADLQVSNTINARALNISKPMHSQLPSDICGFTQLAVYVNSIAAQTAKYIEKLKIISDVKINKIALIGGGSKNKYFVQKLMEYIENDFSVEVGESEATVRGNIKFQMEMDNGRIE